MRLKLNFLILATAMISMAGLVPLQAATISPNIFTDPDLGTDVNNCSLRYAVESINNQTVEVGCTNFITGVLGSNDTIVLVAGTYELTIAGNNSGNDTGDLDVNEPVTISGAGSDLTTIDASGISDGDRVLDIDDVDVTISGLTMTGGDVSGSGDEGGAISTSGVNLTLLEVNISNNQAGSGGGIEYSPFSPFGLMILENSTVDSNIATGSVAAGGGNGCGGGILTDQGTTSIANTTISRNETLVGFGGGICDFGPYLFLTNSTVSSNTSFFDGGGIFSSGGLKGAYNVTITLNESLNGAGGGVAKENPAEDSRFTAEIFNTIIAENTAIRSPECFGPFLTGGNNLIGQIGPNDICTDFVDGVQDDQVGTDTAPIDPLLGPLTNNGGTTETHALLDGSAAIDRGNATACQALDIATFVPLDDNVPFSFLDLTTDQRFLTRPVAILDPNTPICDIGAYELQIVEPTPTPTPTVTPAPPFNAFLEGSGCALTALGSASASGLGSLSLMALLAGFAHWGLRRRRAL